jgi:very-short-patch-repair endonuclease
MNPAELAIANIADGQHQVFSRAQAIAAGLSTSSLDRRVQSKLFVPCGAHTLRFCGTTLTYRGRLMAGLLDLGPDALVSGHAAAELLELDGFTEGRLEFLVPRGQRGRQTGGLVTSSPSISRLDRVTIDGLPCVSCTRAVVQLLSNASERQVGNALDSGTRKRLTAPSVVRRRLDELGTQGRSGVAMFDRVMESAGVQSWLERQFLALMRSATLPRPCIQRTYRRDGTHVARVDFDFEPVPLIIEVGGRKGYLSFDERRRQERRRNELQLLGKAVYFFTTEDVVEDGSYVLRTVRQALAAAA